MQMENLNELNELICFNLYDGKGISILFVVWISFLILQVVKISLQTDVFGFGILVLELLIGQKALDAFNGQIRKGMILEWMCILNRVNFSYLSEDNSIGWPNKPLILETQKYIYSEKSSAGSL
uniref:Uncharacterized protein n=1 Tax=Cucumis melo TaxID=3656 RepID=A0A9I9EB04_CUCME